MAEISESKLLKKDHENHVRTVEAAEALVTVAVGSEAKKGV